MGLSGTRERSQELHTFARETKNNLTSTLGIFRTYFVIEKKGLASGGRRPWSRFPRSPYKNKSPCGQPRCYELGRGTGGSQSHLQEEVKCTEEVCRRCYRKGLSSKIWQATEWEKAVFQISAVLLVALSRVDIRSPLEQWSELSPRTTNVLLGQVQTRGFAFIHLCCASRPTGKASLPSSLWCPPVYWVSASLWRMYCLSLITRPMTAGTLFCWWSSCFVSFSVAPTNATLRMVWSREILGMYWGSWGGPWQLGCGSWSVSHLWV